MTPSVHQFGGNLRRLQPGQPPDDAAGGRDRGQRANGAQGWRAFQDGAAWPLLPAVVADHHRGTEIDHPRYAIEIDRIETRVSRQIAFHNVALPIEVSQREGGQPDTRLEATPPSTRQKCGRNVAHRQCSFLVAGSGVASWCANQRHGATVAKPSSRSCRVAGSEPAPSCYAAPSGAGSPRAAVRCVACGVGRRTWANHNQGACALQGEGLQKTGAEKNHGKIFSGSSPNIAFRARRRQRSKRLPDIRRARSTIGWPTAPRLHSASLSRCSVDLISFTAGAGEGSARSPGL
jgi:hypothetical protein